MDIKYNGEVITDEKGRPIKIIKSDGKIKKFYLGPDAQGFIFKEGDEDCIMVGKEKRYWRGITTSLPNEIRAEEFNEFYFFILKPDAIKRDLAEKIIDFLEQKNFRFVEKKSLIFDKELIFKLYPYFFTPEWENSIIAYFTSGASLCLLAKNESAQQKSMEAKNEIRKKFGNPLDPSHVNLIHSSDNQDKALKEALLVFNLKDLMTKIGKK